MKKTNILPAIAVCVLVGAALLGVQSVSAETGNNDIVGKIATKFNLNQDEVRKVFDEHRVEKKAARVADFSAKLQELVDAGKLTADQKTALENKMKEHQTEMDQLKSQNLTREQMHEKMEAHRDEMEKWASENKIDLKEVMPFGKGVKGGRAGQGPRGNF